MQIRPAILDDVDAMVEVHRACFEKPWDRNALKPYIEQDQAVVLVCNVGQTKAGFVVAQAILDEAEILTICVHPRYRGQGIGCALVRAILDLARSRAIVRIFLEVDEHNAAAYALYNGQGFAIIGRRKGYYAHETLPPTDAIMMAVDIA